MIYWSSFLPAFTTSLNDTDNNSYAVVFVWAAWDPVCRVLDVNVQQAQRDYPCLNFYAMNLDDPQNWPAAQKWSVVDTRTLVCLVDGKFYERVVVGKAEGDMLTALLVWSDLAQKQKEKQ